MFPCKVAQWNMMNTKVKVTFPKVLHTLSTSISIVTFKLTLKDGEYSSWFHSSKVSYLYPLTTDKRWFILLSPLMKQYHTKLMEAFDKEFSDFDYAESDFVDTPTLMRIHICWLRICPNLNPPPQKSLSPSGIYSSSVFPNSTNKALIMSDIMSPIGSSIVAVNSPSFSWTLAQNLLTWCLEPCSSICRTVFLLTKPPRWQRVRVAKSTRLNRCTKWKLLVLQKFKWTCLSFC